MRIQPTFYATGFSKPAYTTQPPLKQTQFGQEKTELEKWVDAFLKEADAQVEAEGGLENVSSEQVKKIAQAAADKTSAKLKKEEEEKNTGT